MFDIVDFFWGPRLIVGNIIDGIKQIGKTKSTKRVFLPMTELDEESLYPRPQLVRDSFFSLDGEWEFANNKCAACPANFDQTIRVPFPPQSKRAFSSSDKLAYTEETTDTIANSIKDGFWYRKVFSLPEGFMKKRLLLHFGAVDQMCECFVNGVSVGIHIGGYLPFSFDITDYVTSDSPITIALHVKDTVSTTYPYGKQVKNPGGMWYTNVSGIWQSVWLESVPENYVKKISTSWDEMDVTFNIEGIDTGILKIDSLGFKYETAFKDGICSVTIDKPKLWSPDEPNLYYFTVESDEDFVTSYFALRTISIEKANGKNRICLNHKPLFMHGVLDQGYFSDGIFTPPSLKYYDLDILSMKELGFNVLRKHIKLEPAYFYNACDRLGILVFQDLINNGDYNYFRETLLPTFFGQTQSDEHFNMPDEAKDFFINHSLEMIDYLKVFPSVVYYTVFNEGWGQFESNRVTRIMKEADSTRIYDSTSGWFKQPNSLLNVSDVESDHFYFHKIKRKSKKRYKPVIISECGGFSLCDKAHSYAPENVYGYGSCEDKEALTDRIAKMYDDEVIPNLKYGISGVIYTQLSDVEEEVNGLYTYDRAVCKVNKEKMKSMSDRLFKAFEKEVSATS
ncbi:MAG: hypothetical protein K6F37_06180 [Lachnospiraceae bacterium]|nr:hypothetical protein [Lachnospiraceae bacterium]